MLNHLPPLLSLCLAASTYHSVGGFALRGLNPYMQQQRSGNIDTASTTRMSDLQQSRKKSRSSSRSATRSPVEASEHLRPGILIVGFGGGNGVTTAAGVIANRKGITWEGPTGRMSPNYLGCITQLPSKGGSGGYRERYALADANDAAIGGWDIRPTPLGEALYNARILDFDLVRQVQGEMDGLALLPGIWDPQFIGESQHASATHVVCEGDSQQCRLDRLRRDIRDFSEREGVTGHVTVIWSASVERPSEREFKEPSEVRCGCLLNIAIIFSPRLWYTAVRAFSI